MKELKTIYLILSLLCMSSCLKLLKSEAELLNSMNNVACVAKNQTRIDITDNYILQNKDKLTDSDIKLLRFIASDCLPVVLVTGLYGTKLQIQVSNCTKFKKNFPNITEACSFDNDCVDGFEHVFWITEKFENSKDDRCTGEILRLNHETYRKRYKLFSKLRTLDSDNTESEDLGFRITFYGNTPKTLKDRDCGFGGTSNLFDKIVYLGNTTPRGSLDFKNFFTNLGYEVGINLFAVPEDWRLRANDEHNYKLVKETVDFAYEVTHKPVILIGHSYGGLISLSYLYRQTQDYKDKKIKHFITIGTPYLNVPKTVKAFILGTEEFNSQFEILGVKLLDLYISMENQKIINRRNPAGFELFPKDFLKKHMNETYIKVLFKRTNIENKISKCVKNLFTKYKNLKSNLFNDDYINETCIKPIILFYKPDLELFKNNFPFFPDLIKGCGKRNVNSATCESEICPSVWDEFCRLNFYNSLTNPLIKIKDGNITREFMSTNTDDFMDLIKKYGLGDPDEEYLNKEKTLTDPNLVDLPNPQINYTLIFSNHAKTEISYNVPENPKNITDQGKYVIPSYNYSIVSYNGGDGSVPTLSALLPGMKWAWEYENKKSKYPVELISYCQDDSFKDIISNSQNKFKTVNCRCDKPGDEKCSHASMYQDNSLLNVFKSYAINENNEMSHDNFMYGIDLVKRNMTNIGDKKCKNLDIFYKKDNI